LGRSQPGAAERTPGCANPCTPAAGPCSEGRRQAGLVGFG